MDAINVAETKSQLSKLIDLALQGKEVIIGKRNTPLVKLSVINPEKKEKRKSGHLKGKIHLAKDFDILPKGIAQAFSGLGE